MRLPDLGVDLHHNDKTETPVFKKMRALQALDSLDLIVFCSWDV